MSFCAELFFSIINYSREGIPSDSFLEFPLHSLPATLCLLKMLSFYFLYFKNLAMYVITVMQYFMHYSVHVWGRRGNCLSEDDWNYSSENRYYVSHDINNFCLMKSCPWPIPPDLWIKKTVYHVLNTHKNEKLERKRKPEWSLRVWGNYRNGERLVVAMFNKKESNELQREM